MDDGYHDHLRRPEPTADELCWCTFWPGSHPHAPDADFQPCPPIRVTREQWVEAALELDCRGRLGL